MKITKSKLKQIIKEEMESILNETEEDEMEWEPEPPPWSVRGPHEMEFGRETADRSDVISQAAAGDIDMLQALEEMIELKGGSKDELAATLERLLDLVEDDPNITHQEDPEMSDESPFRGPDPRKTAELRQDMRAKGGYNRPGWKPRE